jgi:hypothetical protein
MGEKPVVNHHTTPRIWDHTQMVAMNSASDTSVSAS